MEELFGTKGAVPVIATLDGYPHRGTLDPIGGGHHALLVPKQAAVRLVKLLATAYWSLFGATMPHPASSPRPTTWRLPLAENQTAASYYQKLSYEHQRDYVRWLTGAKRAEVRTQRLAETVKRLAQGRRRAQPDNLLIAR